MGYWQTLLQKRVRGCQGLALPFWRAVFVRCLQSRWGGFLIAVCGLKFWWGGWACCGSWIDGSGEADRFFGRMWISPVRARTTTIFCLILCLKEFRYGISLLNPSFTLPNVPVYGMKCPRLWDEMSPFMGWSQNEMSPFMGWNVPVYGICII